MSLSNMASSQSETPPPHPSPPPGVRIAQFIEHPTENPGRYTDAGLGPWCSKGLFHLGSAFSAASLKVSVQPLWTIACISICAHVKNPKQWQPYHCLDTQKCCTHSSEWVALLLQLLCLTWVRLSEFPATGSEKILNYFLCLSDDVMM